MNLLFHPEKVFVFVEHQWNGKGHWPFALPGSLPSEDVIGVSKMLHGQNHQVSRLQGRDQGVALWEDSY